MYDSKCTKSMFDFIMCDERLKEFVMDIRVIRKSVCRFEHYLAVSKVVKKEAYVKMINATKKQERKMLYEAYNDKKTESQECDQRI